MTEEITELKDKFLEYYAEVPIIKYSSAYIGRDRATIYRWMKDDATFATQINKLKSEYLKKTIKQIKSKEWLIERLFREDFYLSRRFEHEGESKSTVSSIKVTIVGGGDAAVVDEAPSQLMES